MRDSSADKQASLSPFAIVDQRAPEECAVSSLRSPPIELGLEFSVPDSRNTGPTVENNKLRAQSMKRHREYITGKLAILGRKRDLLNLEFLLCR
jgi:hypothetical protein